MTGTKKPTKRTAKNPAATVKTLIASLLKPDPTEGDRKAYRRSDLKPERDGFAIALIALIAFVLLTLIWLVWQSVEVYVAMGRDIGLNWMTAETASWSEWGKGLLTVPVIGGAIQWLLNGGAVLISVIGCIALYAVLQIFEVAPILLEHSPQSLRRIIKSSRETLRIAIDEDDSRIIAYLKDRHNTIPEEWANNIYTAQWIAYGIDLVICLVRCPPFVGGWGQFWLFFQSADLSDIDFSALWKIVVTLFAVEAVVHVLLWLKRGRKVLKDNPKG